MGNTQMTDVGAAHQTARRLMEEFATATGLIGTEPPRRYLWTDAFAVCNYLGFYRMDGAGRDLDLALKLVDQVHHVLGRHRPDGPREGWISGLSEDEGERHPTRGGLRIGKRLPERSPDEPFDPRLEWDRDGQYFHYLTQWMHALLRVSEETGQPVFRRWAIELAQAAHAAFSQSAGAGQPPHLAWKMSIDLDRPLVPSTGQHDPLDAWVAYLELSADEVAKLSSESTRPLKREIDQAASMCRDAHWATGDALGAGALLIAAFRLAELNQHHRIVPDGLLQRVLAAAAPSVDAVAGSAQLAGAAEFRLAFRELGLSIGLHAFEAARAALEATADIGSHRSIASIARYLPLATHIDEFWSEPTHRANTTWHDHADINGVMLATSLAPQGYLGTSPHQAH